MASAIAAANPKLAPFALLPSDAQKSAWYASPTMTRNGPLSGHENDD
jgi:hypothetical protein